MRLGSVVALPLHGRVIVLRVLSLPARRGPPAEAHLCYEGEVMLVINPNECIDCGVCEPECPAEAILPDTESGLEKWLELNTNFSAEWPNITRKKDSPADADEHKGEEGKYDNYFTPDGGAGD